MINESFLGNQIDNPYFTLFVPLVTIKQREGKVPTQIVNQVFPLANFKSRVIAV